MLEISHTIRYAAVQRMLYMFFCSAKCDLSRDNDQIECVGREMKNTQNEKNDPKTMDKDDDIPHMCDK